MMNDLKPGKLTAKIFIGFEFPLELRLELNENKEWKQALIEHGNSPAFIQEVHYQDKDYLGYYLDFKLAAMNDLRHHATSIKKQLQPFCKTTDVEKLTITLFPQIFVT